MTDTQHEAIMQALARLVQESAQLKELMLDAIADVGDLQARIEAVNMRFDEQGAVQSLQPSNRRHPTASHGEKIFPF